MTTTTYGDSDDADIGYAATLEFGDDVFKCNDQFTLGEDVDSVETTAGGGTSFRKTFKPGLIDSGEVSFTINLAPGQVLVASRVVDTITLNFPLQPGQATASTWSCDGFLTHVGQVVPTGDRMTQDVTFKLTGDPTFTAGTLSGG